MHRTDVEEHDPRLGCSHGLKQGAVVRCGLTSSRAWVGVRLGG